MRWRIFLSGLLLGWAETASADAPAAASNPPVVLATDTVTAQQNQTMLNTIDRKTYNVAQDLQGVTGSAADILAKIPSVEVDVDGNVSLRGDSNVQILIDGQPSNALKGASGADFLSQFPADEIERIEVITSPSAAFKSDGSAGIINIVLKKHHAPGLSGSVHLLVGNRWRGGMTATGNYNPGKFNLFGSLTLKQDDRIRSASDRRTEVDPSTGAATTTATATAEHSRMFYQVGRAGLDWKGGPSDKLGETVDYWDRTMKRRSAEESVSGGASEEILRFDPEGERDVVSTTSYEHLFDGEDKTLNATALWEHHDEIDDNNFTDLFQDPSSPTAYNRLRLFTNQPSTDLEAKYDDQLGSDTKLEAGLDRSEDRSSENQQDADLDAATDQWIPDAASSDFFKMDQIIDAAYGTYQWRWGDFGAMLGLRGESTILRTNQVTSAIAAVQRYQNLYPTLHTTYDLTENWQLELNYTQRMNRPEAQQLDPYPQTIDPTNLQAGNPYLKPEEVHSLEAGAQYRQGDTTYLASLFYKCTYDGFTTVSQFVSPTTLLTTVENLASSRSGGLELAATDSPWKPLTLNASGDAYYNQIDATNLGYASDRSAAAWTGKLSAAYASSKATLWQLDANYSAKRLTPQGYRLPIFYSNFGVKHDFDRKRWSAVFTISDLFNSLHEETRLDTPTLIDDATRRRNTRVFSLALIWNFGAPTKAKSDKPDQAAFGDEGGN